MPTLIRWRSHWQVLSLALAFWTFTWLIGSRVRLREVGVQCVSYRCFVHSFTVFMALIWKFPFENVVFFGRILPFGPTKDTYKKSNIWLFFCSVIKSLLGTHSCPMLLVSKVAKFDDKMTLKLGENAKRTDRTNFTRPKAFQAQLINSLVNPYHLKKRTTWPSRHWVYRTKKNQTTKRAKIGEEVTRKRSGGPNILKGFISEIRIRHVNSHCSFAKAPSRQGRRHLDSIVHWKMPFWFVLVEDVAREETKGRFWRMYARSGFLYRRSVFCAPVPVFWVQEHRFLYPRSGFWGSRNNRQTLE